MRIQARTVAVIILSAVGVLCTIAAPSYANNEAGVTYYKDVLPLIQDNCQSCHRAEGLNLGGVIAPMSFMSYEETRPWARAIARKVAAHEMPPWFASGPKGVFSNERGLTDAEIGTIVSWVDAGAPAGDRADAPSPRHFAEATSGGWSLGTPDFIFKLDEPYFIDDDVYDLNISFFKELTEADLPADVWVRGWEFRTGASGVAHHMCGFVRPPKPTTSRSRRSRPRKAPQGPGNC